MAYYLLSTQQPDGPPPASIDMDKIAGAVSALEVEMKAAGVWIFNGHLHAPSTATVVRLADNELVTTDGPYRAGTEHVGGVSIVDAPDMDAALEWAGKMARATTLPIEARPFQGGSEDQMR